MKKIQSINPKPLSWGFIGIKSVLSWQYFITRNNIVSHFNLYSCGLSLFVIFSAKSKYMLHRLPFIAPVFNKNYAEFLLVMYAHCNKVLMKNFCFDFLLFLALINIYFKFYDVTKSSYRIFCFFYLCKREKLNFYPLLISVDILYTNSFSTLS